MRKKQRRNEEFMKKSIIGLGLCMAAVFLVSGCGSKKGELPQELDDELAILQEQDRIQAENEEDEVEIAEDVVGEDFLKDGVSYHSDTSKMLKITYPVSDQQIVSKEAVMTSQPSGHIAQNIPSSSFRNDMPGGLRTTAGRTYGFPQLYKEDTVAQVEYTLMNCSGIIQKADWQNDYAKEYYEQYKDLQERESVLLERGKQCVLENEPLTVIPNEYEDNLLIVIAKDLKLDSAHNLNEYDFNCAMCEELNKALICARVTYLDGTSKEEYWGIKTYNENNSDYWNILRYEVQ